MRVGADRVVVGATLDLMVDKSKAAVTILEPVLSVCCQTCSFTSYQRAD